MLLIFWFISNESTIILSANWFKMYHQSVLCHWYVVLDSTSININLIFDTCKAYLVLNITSYIQAIPFLFFLWHYVFDFHYMVAWNISFLFLVFSLTFPASTFSLNSSRFSFNSINFFFKSGQECHFLSRTSPKSGQECPLSNPRDRKWHYCPDLKKTPQISAKILLKCTVSKKRKLDPS